VNSLTKIINKLFINHSFVVVSGSSV